MRSNIVDKLKSCPNAIVLCSSQEEKDSLSEVIRNCESLNPQIYVFNEEPTKKEEFSAVVTVFSDEKFISNCLSNAFFLLKPSGKLFLYSKGIDKALIKKELLFVGFINFEDIGRVDEATCLYYSEKPNFSIDHTVLLNLPKAPKVWNLEDDALIDDNTLLSEDDLKKPSAKDLKLDCGSSVEGTRRRPCKNCTCGLADEFKAKNATFAKSGIVSNCKNCALGDAFRCSNCPYLGMPPFKTDETGRIKLPDVTDT